MGIKDTHHYVGFYLQNAEHDKLQKLAIQNGYATVNGYVKAVISLTIKKEKTAQADG